MLRGGRDEAVGGTLRGGREGGMRQSEVRYGEGGREG